jgi:trans-aconitate 2-methyltransferase
VIQWIPDQKTLLEGLFALLRPGGVLAVQVPSTAHMPIRTAVAEVAARPRWCTRLADVTSTYPRSASFYYDVLASLTASIEIWTTDYLHVMPDHDALVQWYSGTGLRPYLDALTSEEQTAFLAEYRDLLVPAYPPQPDGNILFPFHRIFFTARAA